MTEREDTRTVPGDTTSITITDTGLEPNASAAATTTIPLATDADFLAAEAELLRLLADAEETLKTTPDEEWGAVQAQWWAYHEALLTAEPRTPLQAAIVLRRVLCQHCGLSSGGSNDMNLPAITRVAGFLDAARKIADMPAETFAGLVAELRVLAADVARMRESVAEITSTIQGRRVAA